MIMVIVAKISESSAFNDNPAAALVPPSMVSVTVVALLSVGRVVGNVASNAKA